MAGPDKPDKTKGGTGSGPDSSPRRKATRAPLLDLEATEVKGDAGSSAVPGVNQTSKKTEAAAKTPAPEQKPDTKAKERDTKPKEPDTKPKVAEKVAAKDKAAPEAAAPAPKQADRPPVATIAASAVAGAVLTGLLVVTLGRMGLLAPSTPVQPAPDLTALEARIGAIEAAGPATAGDTGLADRVKAAELQAGEAAEAMTRLSEQTAALAVRIDKIDASLGETATTAQSALTGLEGIEAAVREIGTRPADGSAGPTTEAFELKIANLGQRLDRLAEEAKADSDGGARFDSLAGEIADLRSGLDQVKATLDGVSDTVAGEQKAVGSLREELGSRLDTIEARLGGPGETRGAAAALALAGLSRAVLDGQPYLTEIAAFKALVPDDPAVAVLEPHAGVGVSTRAELSAAFPDLARRVESPPGAGPDAGLGERIMARLQSVVTVRRTGDSDGSGPKAVVARMARAVEMDDLEAAVEAGSAAGDSLPEPITHWLEQARDRIAAEQALEDADGRMIAVLGRTGG